MSQAPVTPPVTRMAESPAWKQQGAVIQGGLDRLAASGAADPVSQGALKAPQLTPVLTEPFDFAGGVGDYTIVAGPVRADAADLPHMGVQAPDDAIIRRMLVLKKSIVQRDGQPFLQVTVSISGESYPNLSLWLS